MTLPDDNLKVQSKEHPPFEMLLIDLSTRFINMPADQIDSAIEESQGLLCQCLEIDRSSLWQKSTDNPDEILLTHLYQPTIPLPVQKTVGTKGRSSGEWLVSSPNGASVYRQISLNQLFPWGANRLRHGEPVIFSSVEELPEEAAIDKESFRRFGTKSCVAVPLFMEGVWFGCLSFASLIQGRAWTEPLIKRFKLVGELYANVLARKNADQTLRRSELRLNLATEYAGVGLWGVEAETRRVWVTPKTRELFRFAADEELTVESFFKVVHPEDQLQVRQAIQHSFETGAELRVEYRLLPQDGTIRWIASRGRLHSSGLEEPEYLMGVSLDITERRVAEGTLREDWHFEMLLADLSARFVNVPAEHVDHEIIDSLHRIGEALDLDFLVLWQGSDEAPSNFIATHYYMLQKGLPPAPLKQEDYPWVVQEMMTGRIVALSSLDELPAEAARDRESALQLGIKSNLTLPLSVGGKLPLGVLALNSIRQERVWPESLVKRLQLIAQIFANAIARKHADQQLRKSEEVNRATFEQAAAGIAQVGTDGRWLRVNDKLCAIVGYSREELLQLTFQEITHPDDLEKDLDFMGQLLSGEIKTHSREKRYIRKDRSVVWINLTVSLVRDSAGEPSHFITVVEDINERKHAEEALTEAWRFEMLIADLSSKFVNLPAGEVDREILDALRSICEALSLDLTAVWQWSDNGPGRFVGTHYYNALQGPQSPGDLKQEDYPWLAQQLLAGRLNVFPSLEDFPPEAALDRENCRLLGIKSSLSLPLVVGGEAPFGLVGLNTVREQRDWPDELVKRLQLVAQIFANAIARKHADQRLRKSEEVNRATFEQAAVGIAHVGTDGRCLRVNDKFCAILGYSREELLQLTFQDITHPDDLEKDLDLMRQVLAAEIETYSMEKRYFRKDRSLVWVNRTVSLVRDSAGEPSHFISVVEDIRWRKQMETELQSRLSEIEKLKQQVEQENLYLREEIEHSAGLENLDGSSKALRIVMTQAQQVAPTNSTVLILGETGTGKELLAKAIHNLSRRKNRIMVKVNCASLPASLVESELFGREKGAFTGALTSQIGRFELANGSTLFLDEIGELSPELQAKLLRVLQEGEFERLGSPKTIRVDVRVIAATNRDLQKEVEEGRFRKDLYYRLRVFPIEMPPLRKRTEDIPALVSTFINEFSEKMGKDIRYLPKGTIEEMQKYYWPGNVRELRNVIEQAFIISESRFLKIRIPQGPVDALSDVLTLEQAEHQHILQALEKCQGRIKGPQGAAHLLGLNPGTLYSKMKKLGIKTARKEDMPTKG